MADQLSLTEACEVCQQPATERVRWRLRLGSPYTRVACPEHVEEILLAARTSEHVMGGTIRREEV